MERQFEQSGMQKQSIETKRAGICGRLHGWLAELPIGCDEVRLNAVEERCGLDGITHTAQWGLMLNVSKCIHAAGQYAHARQ